MRKLSALYKNEILKAVRKPIYIVLLAMIVGITVLASAAVALTRVVSAGVNFNPDANVPFDERVRSSEEDIKIWSASLKENMAKLEKKLGDGFIGEDGKVDHAAADEKLWDEYLSKVIDDAYSLDNAFNQLARHRLEAEFGYDISSYNYNFSGKVSLTGDLARKLASTDYVRESDKYFGDLLEEYPLVKELGEHIYLVPDHKFNEKFDDADYEKYWKICKENDPAAYFETQREDIRADEGLTEDEKKVRIESVDICARTFREDLGWNEWYQITANLNSLADLKIECMRGRDSFGTKLSKDALALKKLQIEEIEKNLLAGTPGYGGKQTTEERSAGNVIEYIGIGLSQILIMIVGALSVAEDFQSGAIKTLIIAPVKRRRILSAKLLLLATATLFSAVLVYVLFVLCMLVFGFGLSNTVFVFAGKVFVMNPFIYYFLHVLASFVPIFFHGCFAFMLSTLFRNAAPAITISMGFVFVINPEGNMILQFIPSYLVKNLSRFLPPANLSLASSVFSSSLTSVNGELGELIGYLTTGLVEPNGPLFSFIYLAVLSALFIFISYQSYCKRDIK